MKRKRFLRFLWLCLVIASCLYSSLSGSLFLAEISPSEIQVSTNKETTTNPTDIKESLTKFVFILFFHTHLFQFYKIWLYSIHYILNYILSFFNTLQEV